MAFENINTELLKNAINSCISSIDYSSSKQIVTDITNNNIWGTASRDNFKKAMEKLINVRYKDLENKLNEYLKLVEQIEKYKSISDSNVALQLQLSTLNASLATLDSENDSDITDKIDSIKSEINSNEVTLASLKSNIELLL